MKNSNDNYWFKVALAFLTLWLIVLTLQLILNAIQPEKVLAAYQTEEPELAPAVRTVKEPETLEWHYELTYEEFKVVVETVAAEANCEDYVGKALIAECILNSCLQDNIRPTEAVIKYQYADPYKGEIQENVITAVLAVFRHGMTLVDQPIMFFYSPGNMPNGVSGWHESLTFVLEHGGHRFFMLNGGD